MLVESGAAIFATTISDVETAADKCEEMEEGYIQCSQFLYGKQLCLPRFSSSIWFYLFHVLYIDVPGMITVIHIGLLGIYSCMKYE